jgi:RimJ/RimL family protein N-acetyltransferase
MKINEYTRIIGDKVILIPYRKHHVEKYHEWMSDEEIRKLTASEPLSLEEEYEMQTNWQLDEDKLTFIVLNRSIFNQSLAETNEQREIEAMVGDVNVFFSKQIDDDEDNDDLIDFSEPRSNKKEKLLNQAEVEIMIVNRDDRRRGFGRESVQLMLNYCMLNIPTLDYFLVKIGEENLASIQMFEKLGFKFQKHIRAFKEISFKLELKKEKENKNLYDLNMEIQNDYLKH